MAQTQDAKIFDEKQKTFAGFNLGLLFEDKKCLEKKKQIKAVTKSNFSSPQKLSQLLSSCFSFRFMITIDSLSLTLKNKKLSRNVENLVDVQLSIVYTH